MNNNVNMLVDPIIQTPAAYMAGTSMLRLPAPKWENNPLKMTKKSSRKCLSIKRYLL